MKENKKSLYIVGIVIAVFALLIGITCAVLLSTSNSAIAEVSIVSNNVNYIMEYSYCGYFSQTTYATSFGGTNSTFTIYNGESVVGSFSPVRIVWAYSATTDIFIYDDVVADYTKRIVIDQTNEQLIYQVRPGGVGNPSTVAHTRINFLTTSASSINNNSSSFAKSIFYNTLSVYNPEPTISLTQDLFTYTIITDPVDNVLSLLRCSNYCTFDIDNVGTYDWSIQSSYSIDGNSYSSYGTFISSDDYPLPTGIVFPIAGYWRLTLYYGDLETEEILGAVISNAVLVTTNIADPEGSYSDGYDVGYSVGEIQGFQRGSSFAEHNNLISLVWSTFKMPFELLFGTFNDQTTQWENGLFTTKFLGVDLRAFVLGILSLSLIIRILRIVLGGSRSDG